MDGRKYGRTQCCVLGLMVVMAAVSQVNSITLASMTWSYVDPNTTLTVCATEDLTTGIDMAHLTVRSADGTTQMGFDGVLDSSIPMCAAFTVTANLPAPEVEERTYELTTYMSTVLNGRGEVTYAFPLSQDATVDCKFSQFTRFSVVPNGGAALSTSDCLTDSTSSACYITVNSIAQEPICVTGLDQSPENAAFKVCVPNSGTTPPTTADLITTVSLAYADDTNGNRFTITPGVETSTNSLELLIQESTDTPPPPSVTTCDGNACTFDGNPSQKLYDLCGVSINGDGSVASVGTHQFQDLQLTVDVVDTTTVDFRFANLNTPTLRYDVYGGDSAQNPPTDTFTLDCSHISETSFCNGFFDYDSSLHVIGVSFEDSVDVVIASVPTLITSAHTPPLKVKQNTVDLTDQKTEGKIPSSA